MVTGTLHRFIVTGHRRSLVGGMTSRADSGLRYPKPGQNSAMSDVILGRFNC